MKHLKRRVNSYDSESDSEGEYEDDDDEGDELGIEKDEVIREIKKQYKVHRNIWIIKPGENTNRGNGI